MTIRIKRRGECPEATLLRLTGVQLPAELRRQFTARSLVILTGTALGLDV
jgi:hypothetical protein